MKRSLPLAPILRCCLVVLGAMQIVALLCAWERPAQAYVDPGSGFVFLQVAGSMVAGALYYLRHRVKRIFQRTSLPVTSTASSPPEVPENQQ